MYDGVTTEVSVVDLQRFKGTAAKAATLVPVTPVEEQEPAVTVPPTRQPA